MVLDFNYKFKKEFLKIEDNEVIKEIWTVNFAFENEWQSFRKIKNKDIEIKTSAKLINSKSTKIAIKVVDIFGNDTMSVIKAEM